MVSLLSAALWYCEQGIPTFPVRARGKIPATEHGFKDATTDPDQIRAWWARNPNYNIGLATGHKFDVIDLDGPAGVAAFEQFRGTMPIIGEATTAREGGGTHVYVPATGHGNLQTKKHYAETDYRGEGGFVVAAPSVGESGRTYTWTRPLKLEGVAADKGHAFYAPFAHKAERVEGSLLGVDLLALPGHEDWEAKRDLDAACWEMFNAEPGGRNHTLNSIAYKVGHLVGAGRLSPDVASESLTRAALAAGLTQHETELTVRSGLAAGASEPRFTGEGAPTAEDDLPSPVDWQALWDDKEVEEWIAFPIIPARRLVALYSAPKVGKSILLLEAAVAIANGTEVFGYPTEVARRVLYIDSENDMRGDVRTRLKAMGKTPADLPNLDYFSFEALGHMDTEAGGAKVVALAKKHRASVVVIDTVSRHVIGEENDNNTWLNWYKYTGMLLKSEGISVVRLDHSGKDEDKGQRGGSAKSGDVDMIWRMSKDKGSPDTVRLHLDDARIMVATKDLTLRREDNPLRHERVDTPESSESEAIKDIYRERLLWLVEHDIPMAGRAKVNQVLKGAGFNDGIGQPAWPTFKDKWEAEIADTSSAESAAGQRGSGSIEIG